MTSLDVCKMKVYYYLKIGVKVGRFLKLVWKISNLNKSRRLKYETFLPVVLKYMPYGLDI